MSYSDFDLRKVKSVFDLTLVETEDLFGKVKEIDIEDYYIKTPRNNFRIHLNPWQLAIYICLSRVPSTHSRVIK